MNMFIVFEGIDASGKETQAKLLAKALKKKGHKVYMVDFPNYKNPIGKMIKKFLDKKVELDVETRALLYAADRRYELKGITKALDDNKIVIADRYCYSNIAYQGSLGANISWLASLDATLVFPDLVFYLDIPAKESLRRRTRKDRYESKREFLERVRETYTNMATGNMRPFEKYKDYAEWITVDGTLPIDIIHKEILMQVEMRLPRGDDEWSD
uniref:Probable thymidylate kinase n=1 Tax=uncultured euryarchaeote Alv-FOS5 TaxID=337891 RepID=Q3SBA4_9EURY|nr:thymidilate kinase [uncultured euryarchaeote Alv-FOS5]